MSKEDHVITGLGIVSAIGIGKNNFWQALWEGKDSVSKVEYFATDKFSCHLAAQVKNFDPAQHLGPKGLRNLDRNALFLMVCAKEAIEDAGCQINDSNTDSFGVCTGTTFSHFWSIVEFDRQVINDGLDFSNPALFPSNVINAASSHVSIKFNIQGFNTTVSTGYSSSLDALKYSRDAIDTKKADTVLCAAVDTLNAPLFFGFHKLGYMAGLKGEPLSCPFDKRRNGPILGEAATVFCLEKEKNALLRKVKIYARVKSVVSFFDGFRISKIHPQGQGLKKAILGALSEAKVDIGDIDYISSCANSSVDLDKIEVKVLRQIFGSQLEKIPVSSIKSMLGETFSAAGGLQIASCIGAMEKGFVPPTINFKEKDKDCDIDCVPNKAQRKDVKIALAISFGPGGYNSACILEKYKHG